MNLDLWVCVTLISEAAGQRTEIRAFKTPLPPRPHSAAHSPSPETQLHSGKTDSVQSFFTGLSGHQHLIYELLRRDAHAAYPIISD